MILLARVLLIVFLLSATCFSEDAVDPVKLDPICGTWVRTQKLADGSQISLIKIITPTHFAVLQQDAAKINRDMFQAHSGRYEVEDGFIIETYEFSSDPTVLGRNGRCRVAVDGDKLRQTWMLNDGITAVEEWNRLRPKVKENATE